MSNAFLSDERLDVRRRGPSSLSGDRVQQTIQGGPDDPGRAFTVGGVASATSVLLALLLVGGAVGWRLVEVSPFGAMVLIAPPRSTLPGTRGSCRAP